MHYQIDIETLLKLSRQMKIPGYNTWRHLCSSGSFQLENQVMDKVNTTLYK